MGLFADIFGGIAEADTSPGLNISRALYNMTAEGRKRREMERMLRESQIGTERAELGTRGAAAGAMGRDINTMAQGVPMGGRTAYSPYGVAAYDAAARANEWQRALDADLAARRRYMSETGNAPEYNRLRSEQEVVGLQPDVTRAGLGQTRAQTLNLSQQAGHTGALTDELRAEGLRKAMDWEGANRAAGSGNAAFDLMSRQLTQEDLKAEAARQAMSQSAELFGPSLQAARIKPIQSVFEALYQGQIPAMDEKQRLSPNVETLMRLFQDIAQGKPGVLTQGTAPSRNPKDAAMAQALAQRRAGGWQGAGGEPRQPPITSFTGPPVPGTKQQGQWFQPSEQNVQRRATMDELLDILRRTPLKEAEKLAPSLGGVGYRFWPSLSPERLGGALNKMQQEGSYGFTDLQGTPQNVALEDISGEDLARLRALIAQLMEGR